MSDYLNRGPEDYSNPAPPGLMLEDYETSSGSGVSASFMSALTGPGTLSALGRSMRQARTEGRVAGWEWLAHPGLAMTDTLFPPLADSLTPEIAPEAANEEGKPFGLTFDSPIRRATLDQKIARAREVQQRQSVLDAMPEGFIPSTAALGASLLGTIADPVNLASSFIPVMGEARGAALAARFGTVGGRAARGVVEGTVGTALTEPLAYLTSANDQEDYGAMDTLLNVALGGALGGGLHVGVGWVRDRLAARASGAPEPDYPSPMAEMVDNAPAASREFALRAALADMATGRPVEVAGFFDPRSSRTADQGPPDVFRQDPEIDVSVNDDIEIADGVYFSPGKTFRENVSDIPDDVFQELEIDMYNAAEDYTEKIKNAVNSILQKNGLEITRVDESRQSQSKYWIVGGKGYDTSDIDYEDLKVRFSDHPDYHGGNDLSFSWADSPNEIAEEIFNTAKKEKIFKPTSAPVLKPIAKSAKTIASHASGPSALTREMEGAPSLSDQAAEAKDLLPVERGATEPAQTWHDRRRARAQTLADEAQADLDDLRKSIEASNPDAVRALEDIDAELKRADSDVKEAEGLAEAIRVMSRCMGRG